jgi:hypothetical protein
MYTVLTLIDGDRKMDFFSDGTFSGVPSGVHIVNYFPLLVRRIQACLRQGLNLDPVWRTIGVTGSVGASQGKAPYLNNILSQNGDDPGGK